MLKNIKVFCTIFACILILCCCSNNQEDINKQSIENRINKTNSIDNNRYAKDFIKTKGSIDEFDNVSPYNTPEEVERRNNDYFDIEYNAQRANRIAETITKFPEVEKTTVIITGNTALIGLDLVSNMEQDKVKQIKKKVEEETFLKDASLKNVSVTASPEIVERITDISNNLSQGRSINGLAQELGSIIRKVTPKI